MSIFKQVLLIITFLFLFVPKGVAMFQGQEEEEKAKLKEISLTRSRLEKITQTENESQKKIAVEAVFLGSTGENGDLLENLIIEALRSHVYWRRDFHPQDPIHITEQIKRSHIFLKTQDRLQKHFRLLLAELKQSTPFFSLRYQGHMNWENTIPGLVGYIATMFYNPNNVTYEASPLTSLLEEQVANDLSKLFGYYVPTKKDSKKGKILSWGHLTCDGTVANIEALWVARNLKYYPLAVKWALLEDKELSPARDVSIRLPSGKEAPLISLDAWSLLNIENDQALSLPEKIYALLKEGSLTLDEVYKRLAEFSVQNLGMREVYHRLAQEDQRITDPVVVVPGTRHYSFPKAVSLLGLGQKSLRNIYVDKDARMDITELNKTLTNCFTTYCPVIAVVAVMGTTEESAVDPLYKIIEMRKMFRKNGNDFSIHADAAWGGYQVSLLRGKENPSRCVPVIPLSSYVEEQFKALKDTDSITVDPHKSGYIQYPAGALCYRNSAMKNMVNFTAPYISSHEEAKPTVGTFGVEGSKPGATAAAVYLSHRVIPLTKYGHGVLAGQALFSTKRFYTCLLAMQDADFIVVPLPRLPTEKEDKEEDKIRGEKEHLMAFAHTNSEELESLKEIGPDLNILVYAFNFRTNGKLNLDLEKANALNQEIYRRLSPYCNKSTAKHDLLVSSSSLSTSEYGPVLLEDFIKRLGINVPTDKEYSVNVIRSVIMNPWITETEHGSFLKVIEKKLRKTAQTVVKVINEGHH